jgi:peptidoglycan/xylan/chitin deacetylase (PgdA/CDA1 family)
MRFICLTFDVEEFDMPLEYGVQISAEQQMYHGCMGVQAIMHILESPNFQTTLFTTANYANNNVTQIQALSKVHEIASHTYYHSSFNNEDLLQSKITLENIIQKSVVGLRMPRMKPIDMKLVKAAGYTYDSSVNPTFLPGKYNNLHVSRTIFVENYMQRIPASVSPQRIPLFWLAFKNMPYNWFKNLCIQTLKKDGYLNLYFHPWEFSHTIQAINIPTFTKRYAGKILVHRLEKLIIDLQPYGSFTSLQTMLANYNKGLL